jgi:hypothetical protein
MCIDHSTAVKFCLIKLSKQGYMVARREVGLYIDQRGVPRKIGIVGEADIQGIMPGGRAIAVEVKTGSQKQTPEQKAWMKRFMELGGKFVLARINEERDVQNNLR